MNEEVSTNAYGIAADGSPAYDQYLPGPIQVLVEWIILIISTLVSFFQKKSAEE